MSKVKFNVGDRVKVDDDIRYGRYPEFGIIYSVFDHTVPNYKVTLDGFGEIVFDQSWLTPAPVKNPRPTLDEVIDFLEKIGYTNPVKELKAEFQPEPPISLELTRAEADAIMRVFLRVGGDVCDTRRGLISNVIEKLEGHDITKEYTKDITGSIDFLPVDTTN